MARTKPEKKTPARNFILEPKVKSRGRGKNKVEVVEGVTKTRLQSRLYCVPVFQGPVRKSKKSSKFECFTSIEAAQKAMGMPELPVPLAPAPGRAKRQGVKELRAEIAKLLEARGAAPAPKPAFSPANLALMEKDMKGLRGLGRKGLRGTPSQHKTRAENVADVFRAFREVANLEDLSEAEESSVGRAMKALRPVMSDNSRWADERELEQLLDPVDPWGWVNDREAAVLERYADRTSSPEALRAAIRAARDAGVL